MLSGLEAGQLLDVAISERKDLLAIASHMLTGVFVLVVGFAFWFALEFSFTSRDEAEEPRG